MTLRSLAIATPLAVALLCSAGAQAQIPEAPWAPGGESRPEDLHIYLYVFGPGNEVVSWWGHIALAVEDARLHHARLYNYGMFSFDNAMLVKFARGRLEFWVGEAPVLWTAKAYAKDNRSVHIQELNLAPSARLQMAQGLAVNVQPENRTYLYDHYRDNCSTRPRDAIDGAIGGQLKRATAKAGRMTLRQHTRRYTAVSPPMSVFLDFMMNDSIDRPITEAGEAFLPDELERQLDGMQYVMPDGKVAPVVLQKHVFARSLRPGVPDTPPPYERALVAIGAGVGVAILLSWRWAAGRRTKGRLARWVAGLFQVLIGLGLGIPGTVLLIMWIATNHTVTFHNENLFLANPLTLLLVPRAFAFARGKPHAGSRLAKAWFLLSGVAAIGLLLKLFPAFDQDNARQIMLILPVLLGGAFGGLWSIQAEGRAQGEAGHGGSERAGVRA